MGSRKDFTMRNFIVCCTHSVGYIQGDKSRQKVGVHSKLLSGNRGKRPLGKHITR